MTSNVGSKEILQQAGEMLVFFDAKSDSYMFKTLKDWVSFLALGAWASISPHHILLAASASGSSCSDER